MLHYGIFTFMSPLKTLKTDLKKFSKKKIQFCLVLFFSLVLAPSMVREGFNSESSLSCS